MQQLNWNSWYDLGQVIPFPDEPGVYEVLTHSEFGRLKGRSNVVFIGSARSLKGRWAKRDLSGAEKWLQKDGHSLEVRWVICATEQQADAWRAST